VVHGGRMIRRLDAERLENILQAFFRSAIERKSWREQLVRILPGKKSPPGGEVR
jgi:hypothetical protein